MQIDCKRISSEIRKEIRTFLVNNPQLHPALAVIMVGDNPASEIYVRNKQKACAEVGIASKVVRFPEDASAVELIGKIHELRNRPDGPTGIMVQFPLPKQFTPNGINGIINNIPYAQDVDCLTDYNLCQALKGEDGLFVPCTPLGIMKVIEHEKYAIANDNAVVIGRSNIVGKPMAALLQKANATVTVCHSHTDREELIEYLRRAKVIVCAVGQKNFLDLSTLPLRSDAIVFDVGINRNDDGKVCGDCYFSSVESPTLRYTPVPGGVGVMTVTALMMNTIRSAEFNKFAGNVQGW